MVLSLHSPQMGEQPVTMAQFSGSNPYRWILQAERYFHFYRIRDDDRVTISSFYFDEDAAYWFDWMFRNHQLSSWSVFQTALLQRFRAPHQAEHPHRELPSIASLAAENTRVLRQILDQLTSLVNQKPPTENDPGNIGVAQVMKQECVSGADQWFDEMPKPVSDETLVFDIGENDAANDSQIIDEAEVFDDMFELSSNVSDSVNVSIEQVVQPKASYVDDEAVDSHETLPNKLRRGYPFIDCKYPALTHRFDTPGVIYTTMNCFVSVLPYDLFDFGSISLVVDVDDPYGFRLLVMGRSSPDVYVVSAKVGLLLDMSEQLVDFPFLLQVFNTNLECWQTTDLFQLKLFDPGISKHLLEANRLIDSRLSVYFVHNRFSPDEYSFPAILKSCAKFMGIAEGRQVHGLVVKMGLLSDLYVPNSVVHFYSVGGECSDAGQVFDEMIVRDTVSWAGIVSGYVRASLFDEALSLFSRMDAVPNVATFVSVLVACGRKGCLRVGKRIHGLAFRRALEENVEANNALLDMYVKCECLNEAKQIFDALPMKDVVSWTTIISGLVHCKRPKESLELFSDMQKLGIKPDGIILTSVLSACASLGALDYGRWVHHYIVRRGIQWDIHIGIAIIDMYAQCGCIALALQTFDGMRSKNVRTWNTLLNGLAMHGHACAALRIFNEMVRLGMRPNEVTFLSILTACCHSGLVAKGRHYFHQMMRDEFKLYPRLEHYGCMVDMLCRAGLLDHALKLIKGMDMAPDVLIIGTLLSACKVNEIGELSQEILDQLVELDSHDSGVHVLLSNVSPTCGGLALCEAATYWRDGFQVQLTGFHSDSSEHADFVLRQWLIPWDGCCVPKLNLADKVVLMGTVLLCTK